MSGFIAELFSLPADQVATVVAGVLLSPAKLAAFAIGMYKALSINYVDPAWKNLADPESDNAQN